MSLATCRECESFIDTDADPSSCIDEDFVCESCREDDAIDDYIHQTINALRTQNAALVRALRGFVQDVEVDYQIDGKFVEKPRALIMNNYENCKQILEQCGF